MADGSLAPTTPDAGLSPGPPPPVLGGAQRTRDELAVAKDYISQADTIEAAKRKAEAGYDRERGELGKPPAYTPPPPFQPPASTTPQQAWSSTAMVFAALASLFTRRPMLTAMNAAAATLNAYQKNDQEAAKVAFQQWDTASKNAIQVATFQQKAYEQLMQEVDRREGRTDKEAVEALAELKGKFQALHGAFQDARMEDALASNNWFRVRELIEARARMVDSLEKSGEQVAKGHYFMQGMAAWQAANPPPGPGATPKQVQEYGEKQIVEAGRLHKELGGPLVTPAQAIASEQKLVKNLTAPNTVGAKWESSEQNFGKLLDFMKAHAGQNTVGLIKQGSELDLFVRGMTNQAIRGFQLQLMTKEKGVVDRIHGAAANFLRGGILSPEMMADMEEMASDALAYETQRFADAITSTQWYAHKSPGLDPLKVVPPNWVSKNPPTNPKGEAWPSPSQKAIDHLKAHDTARNWVVFDESFGQGAAAAIMGAGNPAEPSAEPDSTAQE